MDEAMELLELLELVRDGVQEAVPDKLWVRAEIASLQAKANGHCYLELCQNEKGKTLAKARAVIWKGVYFALRRYFHEATGSDIAAGMQVLVRVEADFSELYGFTLVIDSIEPGYTLGAAEMEKRKTLERLQKEGLLEKQKGLAMPGLPYRLAVISARDAAGYGDFLRHLTGNECGYVFRPELTEATMQGENAPGSIIEALQCVESEVRPDGSPLYDAVLILRGGGSRLDLAFADDYDLAFSIANCSLPVLTAIGHDRDLSVADLVAYDYVKTPTALADYFIDMFADADAGLDAIELRLKLAIESRLSAMESRLNLIEAGLKAAVEARIQKEEHALALLESRIAAADPRGLLSKGYALVSGSDGRMLKSAAAVNEGDVLRLHFADGELEVQVTKAMKRN